MNYKRLEIYVGWTCNQKCTYCIEYSNMEQAWNKKVTKYDILKKLLKYKKLGYNHVTYLGGEPFIQPVFYDALKIGKKLGYTILVATNCTTLHLETQAAKFLPYIDELFLSVEAILKDDQQKISRTNNYVHWDGVFKNINKYWNGKTLKVNIVITKDNINLLFSIVDYLYTKGIVEISITYPDISYGYYGKKHIIKYIAPKYSECIKYINNIIDTFGKKINFKIVDFPFCVFSKDRVNTLIKYTDDYDYQTRLKIDYAENEFDRGNLKNYKQLPRKRKHCVKCKGCIYKGICWGPSLYYEKLFGLDEINGIYEKI